MNNTFSLHPSIQGEHVDSTVKGKALKEEHIVLSAIAETDDIEYYDGGLVSCDSFVTTEPNDFISSQVPYYDGERSQINSKQPECWSVLSDNVSNRTDHPHSNLSQRFIKTVEVCLAEVRVRVSPRDSWRSPRDILSVWTRSPVNEILSFTSERADLHADNKSTDAPKVFVHPSIMSEPLGRTDPWGSTYAASLLDPNGDVLDLGPADRIDSPWPGDYISIMSLSPPNYVPLASTSEARDRLITGGMASCDLGYKILSGQYGSVTH